MKSLLRNKALATAVALVVVGAVATPPLMLAYVTLGGSLGMSTAGNGYQRDFRIWNNSPDASANNNITPNASYPGALGAVMAVWKGAKSWASDDPSASKNFDFDFQGEAAAAGSSNNNIVSWATTGCGGGTLAYCETPISDGWRIIMCESWTWDDGPGSPGSNEDIQGIVSHELGHALGLDHSDELGDATHCSGTCSNRATMCAFICGDGTNARTAHADDAAGLEAVYGAKPANKPTITSLSGSTTTGGTLVINGTNFAPVVNVKFTAGTSTNTGAIPGTVYSVPSSGGGTQVSVTIPASAQAGNVIVWQPASGLMSNAFPINVGFVPPPAPNITSFTPDEIPAFVPGILTINGTGFTGATQLTIGGNVLVPPAFSVVNDTKITWAAATPTVLGPVSVTVTGPTGTSAPSAFTYVDTVPAVIQAPNVTLTGLTFTWNYGAGADDLVYLLVSLSPFTVDIGGGNPLLADFLLVDGQVASPLGFGNFSIVMPPGLGGLTFYSQVGCLDDASPGAFHISNVVQTLIIF